MEVQIQSYLAKNKVGETIFKIEQNNIDPTLLNFKCSLDIDFAKHPGMKKLIDKLVSPEPNLESKAKVFQNLLSRIATIEAVKTPKEKDSTENIHNTLNSINEILVDIFVHDEFDHLAPISESQNPIIFREVIDKLTQCIPDLPQIDRNTFESAIAGHTEIEDEYINNYSTTASFYAFDVANAHICYKFYLMQSDDFVLFFFMK